MKTAFITIRPAGCGFTLVEVMLAMGIVALGLMGILALFPNALQSSRDAADTTLAATIAQDAISEARVQSFAALASSGTITLNYDSAGFSNDATPYYRLSRQCDPDPSLQLVRVTAKVLWPAPSPTPMTNVFVTFIANYDQP